MLQHVPEWLGQALSGVRAGAEKLCIAQAAVGDATIELSSPAFANGGRLPVRFTADGEGVSPPLLWGEVPPGTRSLALIVEDPDAPLPQPIVHAVVLNIPADARSLPEGAIQADGAGDGDGTNVGRNSYYREGWLPPDPPTGHGPHDYAFQLFALSVTIDRQEAGDTPGRTALAEALSNHVLGAGLLTGRYSRGEAAGTQSGLSGDAALAG